MTLNELLDTARLTCQPASDYELAKRLGIHRGRISSYRSGTHHPSNQVCIQLVNMTCNDPIAIIAMVEYISAKKEKTKDFWRSFLEMRHIAYAVFIAVILSLALPPQNAEASTLHNYSQTDFHVQKQSTIYIIRNWLRRVFNRLRQIVNGNPPMAL